MSRDAWTRHGADGTAHYDVVMPGFKCNMMDLQAAIGLGLRGRVIVTDANPLSPAVQVADGAFRVPLSTEPGYLEAILDLCEAEQVDLVVPTTSRDGRSTGSSRSRCSSPLARREAARHHRAPGADALRAPPWQGAGAARRRTRPGPLHRAARRRPGRPPSSSATTTHPADDDVAAVATHTGADVFRGPDADVLERFALVSDLWTAPFLIRATADNPAVDIDAPGRVLQHLRTGADYVVESGLPVGAAVEGVRRALVRVAANEATDPYDREHVLPFLKRRPERFRVLVAEAPPELRRSRVGLTVDTAEDLAFVRRVIRELGDTRLAPLARLIAAADRWSPAAEDG
jgi:spore coat polysaccharide biosynthesis protein SpsF